MINDVTTTSTGSSTGRKILIVIIVIVIIIVLYQVYKAIKTASEASGEILGAEIIQQKTGITPDRQSVCKVVARDCENAVTRIPFIGTRIWAEDSKIVDALNRLVTKEEAALTCVFYRQQNGDGLKSLVEGGLFVESNRKRITLREFLT